MFPVDAILTTRSLSLRRQARVSRAVGRHSSRGGQFPVLRDGHPPRERHVHGPSRCRAQLLDAPARWRVRPCQPLEPSSVPAHMEDRTLHCRGKHVHRQALGGTDDRVAATGEKR